MPSISVDPKDDTGGVSSSGIGDGVSKAGKSIPKKRRKAMNDNVKRRPGRPRKHSQKLVPVTGYVLPETRSRLDLITDNIGQWVRELIEAKLA